MEVGGRLFDARNGYERSSSRWSWSIEPVTPAALAEIETADLVAFLANVKWADLPLATLRTVVTAVQTAPLQTNTETETK